MGIKSDKPYFDIPYYVEILKKDVDVGAYGLPQSGITQEEALHCICKTVTSMRMVFCLGDKGQFLGLASGAKYGFSTGSLAWDANMVRVCASNEPPYTPHYSYGVNGIAVIDNAPPLSSYAQMEAEHYVQAYGGFVYNPLELHWMHQAVEFDWIYLMGSWHTTREVPFFVK